MGSIPTRSAKQDLEKYDHIHLTDDELDEAVLEAKIKKEIRLEEEHRKARIDANLQFIAGPWPKERVKTLAISMAKDIFGDRFIIDEKNLPYVRLLCCYFACDQVAFMTQAEELGIENADIRKGLFLAGGIGAGKTWLMSIFKRNPRQCFVLQSAQHIAGLFNTGGEKELNRFMQAMKLPANDIQNFLHPTLGLCIDDIGVEMPKNNFGNGKNVIGDIIHRRYELGSWGDQLHMISNLTEEQIENLYGSRAISRLNEMVNIIDIPGHDRRK